jgi:dTDP-4-dehydrorhamnose 3,5-epimerase
MNFIETELAGAYVIEPSLNEDERGRFARVFCKTEFSKIGHHKEFVQFNHSLNKIKGTVRGMHFQKQPKSEIKLIKCIKGSVFDVMVDLRSDSKTYLKWFAETITAQNMKMLYIPEGFAHGFQTLEENCELLYYHTEYYSPQMEGGINALDKAVNIKWPVEIALMSDRDKLFSFIDKNSKFF